MSMIDVSNLTFGYEGSPELIFDHVGFQIDSGWKLGFTGRNGRGKTTFLRLLQGEYPYSGTISASVEFEYFPYEVANLSRTGLEVVREIAPEAEDWEIQRELGLLDLAERSLELPFSSLSNGERTKVLLAAMFLTGISKGAITDYNNRVMSEYANGSATPLNMMHAAYAFGACVAPLAVLACHKLGGDNGWRLALEISIVLLTASFIFGLFMKMDDDKSTKTEQKSATDYGFFREKLFWLCTALCFFYEAVEASMMGWLTSFYIDSGVLAADAAQIITSLLWVSLLIGRFSCSVIAAKFRPWQMITVMCFGVAAFLVLLVTGTTLPILAVATIGLGLCMSGMYGTTVANAGDLFSRYPASMGIYVTLNGFGAAMAPAAIGIAANRAGIRWGFATLLIAGVLLVVSAVLNARYFKGRQHSKAVSRA